MRPLLIVGVLLLVSCSGGGATPAGPGAVPGGGSGPASGGASGGGTPLAAIGLQASDVPSGFVKCPRSEDVSSSADQDTKSEWQYQQGKGATAGYVTIYAATSAECETFIQAGLSVSSAQQKNKLIASLVLELKDPASAQGRAKDGAFGLSSGGVSSLPTKKDGSATGYGDTSFYGFGPTLGAAGWVKGTRYAGVIVHNLTETDLQKAASAVYGRS